MVDKRSCISRADQRSKAASSANGSDTEDKVKCSGKYCKSCTASFAADCVAICCCPCAVFSMLTLAFVKVPWNVGRRCLVFLKKRGRNSAKRLETDGSVIDTDGGAIKVDGNVQDDEAADTNGIEAGEKFCARVEGDRVWLELYQVGHLGFGRVSFTEIQEKGC